MTFLQYWLTTLLRPYADEQLRKRNEALQSALKGIFEEAQKHKLEIERLRAFAREKSVENATLRAIQLDGRAPTDEELRTALQVNLRRARLLYSNL